MTTDIERYVPETRKVLYSPGYGAGWSTWNDDKMKHDFLFDADLIEAVEYGEWLGDEKTVDSPIYLFEQKMKEKYDTEYVCLLGARDLCVTTVSGPFIVEDYDGNESILQRSATDWI